MSEYEGFSAEERAAMKDRAAEKKKAARSGKSKEEKAAEALRDLLAKIAELPDADRVIAERIHEIVTVTAPELAPRLYYGMPAYYSAKGKNVCFFQPASKFGVRYCTLGFEEGARLDDGEMWATAFAVTRLTVEVEERVAALVKQAVG